MQRIFGRIVNFSSEDDKLKSDSIGLFNIQDGSGTVFKLKLNMSEVQSYSVFEGECVVAEGYNDSNSRFNVNRLHKPSIVKPDSKFELSYLEQCHEMQDGRAL